MTAVIPQGGFLSRVTRNGGVRDERARRRRRDFTNLTPAEKDDYITLEVFFKHPSFKEENKSECFKFFDFFFLKRLREQVLSQYQKRVKMPLLMEEIPDCF